LTASNAYSRMARCFHRDYRGQPSFNRLVWRLKAASTSLLAFLGELSDPR
jgi:hypothetical protein